MCQDRSDSISTVFSEPLTGETLALDLVNTLAGPPGEEVDFVGTTDALRSWLAAEHLDPGPGELDPAPVQLLRAHIRAAVNAARAGERPPQDALGAITAATRNAPLFQELGWNGEAITVAERRRGDPAAIMLAQIAAAAAGLLSSPAIRQVRNCEGQGCRMLFLPANPRRRWCSPAVCGNRARVARYYQRHKD